MRGATRREGGFTYLGLLILVTIVGLVGAATLKADALLRRAAAERELLEIGAAFSAALRSYADATPRGQPQQPPSLRELLKDPRYPGLRRHLRKIFVDPMTGKAEWGIVYAGGVDGTGSGVLAVYSLSQARPLKIANFDVRFQNLDNKERISDWKFAASGQGVVQQPAPGLAAPLAAQAGQAGQAGQAAAPVGPGAAQAPAEPPSLFPARAAPLAPADAPVAASVAAPAASSAPADALAPSAPVADPRPVGEASGRGDAPDAPPKDEDKTDDQGGDQASDQASDKGSDKASDKGSDKGSEQDHGDGRRHAPPPTGNER